MTREKIRMVFLTTFFQHAFRYTAIGRGTLLRRPYQKVFGNSIPEPPGFASDLERRKARHSFAPASQTPAPTAVRDAGSGDRGSMPVGFSACPDLTERRRHA